MFNVINKSNKHTKSWYMDIVRETEHTQRIRNVIYIKQYLLRKHNVLRRNDMMIHKQDKLETAKIVLNIIKSILDTHCSYVIGNPISLSGEPEVVGEYNKIYKKSGLNKIDYHITEDLYKYGNAFEYVFLDGNQIKSKIIANEDSFPVYDDKGNYLYFIEHWRDLNTLSYEDSNYIIYFPDRVEEYEGRKLVSTKTNLTGLPIHYCAFDKSEYDHFGESILNDLIPIIDRIEYLLSKMDDSITIMSLNPLGVAIGQKIESTIPKDLVGAVLNLDEGDFKYVTQNLDSQSLKLLLDTYTQQLYTIAGVPSSIMGQSNISNVSETSLKMLFTMTDNKARKTIHVLKEGMFKRFEYIRKLLSILGTNFTNEAFELLDVNFNVNRPIDTKSQIEELKCQREMGAISIQSIIDISPYTTNVALEMQRIEDEKKNIENENKENV